MERKYEKQTGIEIFFLNFFLKMKQLNQQYANDINYGFKYIFFFLMQKQNEETNMV